MTIRLGRRIELPKSPGLLESDANLETMEALHTGENATTLYAMVDSRLTFL
jgi:hypothetical protein